MDHALNRDLHELRMIERRLNEMAGKARSLGQQDLALRLYTSAELTSGAVGEVESIIEEYYAAEAELSCAAHGV
jgi:hypothetical protein